MINKNVCVSMIDSAGKFIKLIEIIKLTIKIMDSTAKHGLCEICLWSIQHAKISTLLRFRHYLLCSADPRQQDCWCIPTVGDSAAEKGLGRVRKCFLQNLKKIFCRLKFFFGRRQALGGKNLSFLLFNAM